MRKKLISVLVVCAMVLMLLPMTAFAAEAPAPVISTTTSALSGGVETPEIVVTSDTAFDLTGGANIDNWTIDVGDTGLTAPTAVTIEETNLKQAKLGFSETSTAAGTIAITANAEAFGETATAGSNALTIEVLEAGAAAINTESAIANGAENPTVTVTSDKAFDETESANVENWQIEVGDTGLTKPGTVSYNADTGAATLTFTGIAKAGEVTIKALAAVFSDEGITEPSNTLTLTVPKAVLSADNVSIDLTEAEYDGENPVTLPTVTVAVEGAALDEHYTVAWADSEGNEVSGTVSAAGEYTVTVAAVAENSLIAEGEVKLTFTVTPKPVEADVTASQEGGKTTATVNSVTVEEGKDVRIDATNDGALTGGTSAEVTMPKAVTTALAAHDGKTEIETPVGTAVLSQDAMKLIDAKATESASAKLIIEPKALTNMPDKAAVAACDIYVTVGAERVTITGLAAGSELELRIPVDQAVQDAATAAGEKVVLVYIGGTEAQPAYELVNAESADGYFTFQTNHLSVYAQMTEGTARAMGIGVAPADLITVQVNKLTGLTELTFEDTEGEYEGKWIYFQVTGNNGALTGSSVQIANAKAHCTTSIQTGKLLALIFEQEPAFDPATGRLTNQSLIQNTYESGNGVELK